MDGPVITPDHTAADLWQTPCNYPDTTEVHALESSVEIDPTSPDAYHIASDWRHRTWTERRKKVISALDGPFPERRRQAFAACGCYAWVEHSPSTDRVRIRGNFCHDRFCEPCGKARTNRIARNIQDQLEDGHAAGRQYRLITLTLRQDARPLGAKLDHLLKSFRKLRSAPQWKGTQAGGAAIVEVKRTAAGWHPHLHVIVEGHFIHQSNLSEQWRNATGTSHIVDVRMVRDLGHASHYVAKYAAKPLDPTVFESHDLLQEAMLALRGRRLCTTIGTWRGLRLEKQPEHTVDDWVKLWSLALFLTRLRAADPEILDFVRQHSLHFDDLADQPRLWPQDSS